MTIAAINSPEIRNAVMDVKCMDGFSGKIYNFLIVPPCVPEDPFRMLFRP